MASVKVPELVQKLKLIYAHTDLDQKGVAEELEVAQQTLNTWINGSDKRRPGDVPHDGREKLAALLMRKARRPVTLDGARDAWMGSVDSFARLFLAGGRERFLELFTDDRRGPFLHYLERGIPERGLVGSPYVARGEADRIARIGDTFALELRTPAFAWAVVFVETTAGVYLLGPGPTEAQAPASGVRRVPGPGLPLFDYQDPPGRHRFLVVVIEGGPAPQILGLLETEGAVPEEHLAAFSEALRTDPRISRWAVDQLGVEVRPRD